MPSHFDSFSKEVSIQLDNLMDNVGKDLTDVA
jgi:hypothetical protein